MISKIKEQSDDVIDAKMLHDYVIILVPGENIIRILHYELPCWVFLKSAKPVHTNFFRQQEVSHLTYK